MRELETEHEGQITFSIVQTAGQEAESGVEAYDVGNHGLVVFDAAGEVVKTIPGHNFKREELDAVCAELLAGGS